MTDIRRSLLRAGAAAAALGAAAAWLGARDESPRGQQLPAFTTLQGQPMGPDLAPGQRGLLVSFWATTCTICVQELPTLAQLGERWSARGIALVAVAMAHDREEMVRHFVRMNPRLPPIALDAGGSMAAALGPIRETPTHCLLDRTGRVHWRGQGPLRMAALEARLQALASAPVR